MAQYNTNLVAENNVCLTSLQPVTNNTKLMVAENNACLLWLESVTNNTLLRCCGRSCHINCAHNCTKPSTKRRPIFNCPSCLYPEPLAVLKIPPFQAWKEDVQFAEQVKAVWKDNPLWYAPCYAIKNHVTEGYWGRTQHPIDYNRHIIYFLGHTKSEVIPYIPEDPDLNGTLIKWISFVKPKEI